jgi:uncharacterized repeat protein (TIGR03803 family)
MKSRTLSLMAAIAVVVLAMLAVPAQLSAQQPRTYTVLYAFTGGSDGAIPNGLIRDKKSNLYGTTASGGDPSCSAFPPAPGCGVVFKLTETEKETALYSFTGGADGGEPSATLVQDEDGKLYGTTAGGGASGQGVVFKLDRTGKQTVLYSFAGGTDGGSGGFHVSDLVRDKDGNLYGTTYGGGDSGVGVVFKVDLAGRETVLHSFTGAADGGQPFAALVRDEEGNLYGTSTGGGASRAGVVFKLDPTGKETVLYSFTGGADGGQPVAPLLRDREGNLYGATGSGGNLSGICADIGGGCGTVFKLSRCHEDHFKAKNCDDSTRKFTVLFTFSGRDGALPYGGLVQDEAGNLYGTTLFGGDQEFGGVVFRLGPNRKETVLHSFTGGADGSNPYTETLVLEEAARDGHGGAGADPDDARPDEGRGRGNKAVHLYGTTQFGGNLSGVCSGAGCGVAFKLTVDDKR